MKIVRCALSTLLFASTMRMSAAFLSSGGWNLSSSASIATATTPKYMVFDKLFGNTESSSTSTSSQQKKYPILADESVMSQKAHGTSEKPVQSKLRWNCDYQTADRICNFNRHYAEYSGYWMTTDFMKYVKEHTAQHGDTTPIEFYDSVTGKLLFQAPVGRTMDEYVHRNNENNKTIVHHKATVKFSLTFF